jgi:hypothetical protein
MPVIGTSGATRCICGPKSRLAARCALDAIANTKAKIKTLAGAMEGEGGITALRDAPINPFPRRPDGVEGPIV